jgi:hypothetical protein
VSADRSDEAYFYSCYALTVRVPFRCRWLPAARASDRPDVVVSDGTVADRLDSPAATDVTFDAEPGRFLSRGGARAARFLVESGGRVTVDRADSADDETVAAQFLSQVLPAVMRQRGHVVLHADAVVLPNAAAIAISGGSGAGKTTTTMALLARGAAHLADDAVVVQPASDGGVTALPGPGRLHLDDDAASRLGIDTGALPRYPLRQAKAVVEVPASARSATALVALFVINQHPGPDVRVRRVQGVDAFALIQDCIYGPLLSEEHARVFPLLASLADSVAVYVVDRPDNRWTAEEVAAAILDTATPQSPSR